MKPLLILALTLIYSTAFSQISLELAGGVGFDINKFNTQYADSRKPLYHTYPYDGKIEDAQFTILEPRSVGANLYWRFSKKLGLSVGLEGRYSQRGIIGSIDCESGLAFCQLDIDLRRLLLGGAIKKEFALNEKSNFFFKIGLLTAKNIGGTENWLEEGKSLSDFNPKNSQLVKYVEDEEYYTLILLADGHNTSINKILTFTQGYSIEITPKLSLCISNSVLFEHSNIYNNLEGASEFIILGWDNVTQTTAFGYSSTVLRFSSIMVDLSLKYEF